MAQAPKEIPAHERLCAWKKKKQKTLQEMGDAIGVTRQSMSMMLLGERRIAVQDLETICYQVFDCSLVEFFGPLPERAA